MGLRATSGIPAFTYIYVKKVGQWTMWLRATSRIPTIPYMYENGRTVDHMVTGHFWDSRYRSWPQMLGQWTMWLRATSGIPAITVDQQFLDL